MLVLVPESTGWGGGITADYWTDSYYVQGLFGASAFSGDQDRSIVAIGGDLGGGKTLSGNKNVTSYIGALRAGAPMQVGSFYLEPQAQATWSGNQEDSFSEGGNTNFKLKYKSRETNFLQTELGIKVAYPIAMGKTQQLVPSIRVAWLGDWNMDNEGQKIGYRFSNKTIDLESTSKIKMVPFWKVALITQLPISVLLPSRSTAVVVLRFGIPNVVPIGVLLAV